MLSLDPNGVLSAWEKMGGSAFCETDEVDAQLDPSSCQLDLSTWEARLKPPAPPAPAPVSHLDASIFAALFTPAEMGLAFLPGCCPMMPMPVPMFAAAAMGAAAAAAAAASAAAMSDAQQVVPMCPTMSGGSSGACAAHVYGSSMGAGEEVAADEGAVVSPHCPHAAELDPMHFPTAAASPSHSLADAGVVPDLGTTAAAAAATPTASGSGSGGNALAPPPPSFVPVTQSPLRTLSGMPAAALQEAVADAEMQQLPHMPQCAATPAPTAPPQQQQQQQPRGTKQAQAAAAAAAQAAAAAAAAAGYVRTRAECLERYREKKARRMYTKKIRYVLRKVNADKRPRIKGRFVRKEELASFLAMQRAEEEGEEGVYGMFDSDDE